MLAFSLSKNSFHSHWNFVLNKTNAQITLGTLRPSRTILSRGYWYTQQQGTGFAGKDSFGGYMDQTQTLAEN